MNKAKREFMENVSRVGSMYVDLEKFKPYRVYAITYSPEKQPSDCNERSLATFHWFCIKEWEELKLNMVYALMPEFGQKNRLHYHGLIGFSSGMNYIKFRHAMENQHVVIKEIDKPKIWYVYMLKQWTHLKKVFTTPFTNNRYLLSSYYEQMVWCRIDSLLDDPC